MEIIHASFVFYRHPFIPSQRRVASQARGHAVDRATPNSAQERTASKNRREGRMEEKERRRQQYTARRPTGRDFGFENRPGLSFYL